MKKYIVVFEQIEYFSLIMEKFESKGVQNGLDHGELVQKHVSNAQNVKQVKSQVRGQELSVAELCTKGH